MTTRPKYSNSRTENDKLDHFFNKYLFALNKIIFGLQYTLHYQNTVATGGAGLSKALRGLAGCCCGADSGHVLTAQLIEAHCTLFNHDKVNLHQI